MEPRALPLTGRSNSTVALASPMIATPGYTAVPLSSMPHNMVMRHGNGQSLRRCCSGNHYVKMVGATAQHVAADLDKGPFILCLMIFC
jgi:hypothetical protein